MKQSFNINLYLKKIILPKKDSHKGQNGKLLIIGGSELFHAASRWSLDVASKFVDMVFYSSIPENNQLIKEAKGKFWNGIVITKKELDFYIAQADCILIGPGMMRSRDTKKMTDALIKKYPHKKMVIDAGALQMMNIGLLNKNHILTPHHQEMEILEEKLAKIYTNSGWKFLGRKKIQSKIKKITEFGATILLKGPTDAVFFESQKIEIFGGNPGMTKGGTGDVLSGLVAALYCRHDSIVSSVVGSYINKLAGEFLYKSVGPFFNATDLTQAIPEVFWRELNKIENRKLS